MNSDAFEIAKSWRRADCVQYEEFDKKYNVDTAHKTSIARDGSGEMVPGTLKNFEKYPGSTGYQNTPIAVLNYVNDYLSKLIDTTEYNFIDVGCGKGRVLIWNNISDSKYKKQIGIEIDKSLCEIAEKNIAQYPPAEILNIDIADYIHEDEKSIYFIYHPCHVKRWESFLSKNTFPKDTIIVNYTGFEVNQLTRVYIDDSELKYGFNKIHEENLIYFYRNN